MNKELFKRIIKIIKYGLIVSAIALMAHVFMLEFGLDYFIVDWMFGLSAFGACVLFITTYVLGFCNIMRCYVAYDFLVSQCIMVQKYWEAFGEFRHDAHILVLLIGMVLLAVTVTNRNCECGESYYEPKDIRRHTH